MLGARERKEELHEVRCPSSRAAAAMNRGGPLIDPPPVCCRFSMARGYPRKEETKSRELDFFFATGAS